MATTHVQGITPSAAVGSATTFDITMPSGNIAVGDLVTVGICDGNLAGANDVVSVLGDAGAGETYLRAAGFVNNSHPPGGVGTAWIYYVLASTGGYQTVRITMGGALGVGEIFFGMNEFLNAAGTFSLNMGGVDGISNGTGTALACDTLTPNGADDVLYAIQNNNDGSGSITTPTGYTENHPTPVSRYYGTAYKIATSASAETPTWTLGSSQNWCAVHAQFKFTAGAGAVGPVTFPGLFSTRDW